jgi:hypothetical protein
MNHYFLKGGERNQGLVLIGDNITTRKTDADVLK